MTGLRKVRMPSGLPGSGKRMGQHLPRGDELLDVVDGRAHLHGRAIALALALALTHAAADGAHGLGGGGQPRDDLGLELLEVLEARAVVLEAARRARLAAVVVVRDV